MQRIKVVVQDRRVYIFDADAEPVPGRGYEGPRAAQSAEAYLQAMHAEKIASIAACSDELSGVYQLPEQQQ